MIVIERVYRNKEKGFKILVDRVWPRGLSKEQVSADVWEKDIAPSNALRKWFSHDESKWDLFKKKYEKELSSPHNIERLKYIKSLERKHGKVILLFGAKDEIHNQAVVLKQVLDKIK
ncbi:MAG: DUF488 domain-containing protein [Candidatus Parvarchaeum sp.]